MSKIYDLNETQGDGTSSGDRLERETIGQDGGRSIESNANGICMERERERERERGSGPNESMRVVEEGNAINDDGQR